MADLLDRLDKPVSQ